MISALKPKMIKIKKLLCFILILLLILLAVIAPRPALAISESALIYQVQTGASSGASQEYISIYNNSDQPIDLTGWCIVYSSASDVSQSQLGCFDPSNLNTKVFLNSHKAALLASNDFVQANTGVKPDLIFNAGMSGTSGHVKLLDNSKNVIDKVGWGSALQSEGTPAPAHPAGNILQRVEVAERILKDTDNNSVDFRHAPLSISESGIYEEFIRSDSIEAPLVLTELMPDAIGSDAGKEFIEIYNPSDHAVNLKNYSIQLSPAFSKNYTLPDKIIEPKSYIALGDDLTKATLSNTSSSVRLLNSGGEILSQTEVYKDLGEGVSWALIGNSWQMTYHPTPGFENILLGTKPCPEGQLRSEETGYCRNLGNIEDDEKAECRTDQERNLETGRCRKIPIMPILQPCKVGQVRSLETGRCRSIVNSATNKVPCKPGQERNPDTGRCRKISDSASAAKPCPAGQERNKETNRCRKAAPDPSGKNKIKDMESPLIGNNAKWWFAGISAMGSAGYAVYEWRREAFGLLSAIKGKFMG